MEDRVGEHPFFGGQQQSGPQGPPPQGFFGFGPFGPGPGPHSHHGGRHGRHHGHAFAHRGRNEDNTAAQQTHSEGEQPTQNEKSDEDRNMPDEPIPDPPEDDPANPPRDGDNPCGRGRGRCGGRRGWGGRRHHGWGHPYHQGFPFNHMGGQRGFPFLNEMFGGPSSGQENEESSNDWKPDADVFDTEGAFVIHVSLPGANKEDIGVSWDPEKSELSIAGVVHRPGDEAFLKTLALDERKVGAFERKVRLGTRSSPAQVDVEGITARLENGILHIEVPKLHSDFVEIKKVDIE
jgi:HSP20 family protein